MPRVTLAVSKRVYGILICCTMEKLYEAAMILGAVGDTLGYKNSKWKFCSSGKEIQQNLESLGGLNSLRLCPEQWPVSDETILLLATARVLSRSKGQSKISIYHDLCQGYVDSVEDVKLLHPDPAFLTGCQHLRPGNVMSWHIPFDTRASGFGAATRAMCIGLRYPHPDEVFELIEVAVESGRMTHNHPTGFLGSVCTALFTSFAYQKLPIYEWGRKMLSQIPLVKEYCSKTIRHTEEYSHYWFYFTTKWEMYLKDRKILLEGENEPLFPSKYESEDRDKIYKSWSSEGQPGRRGHDVTIIAYDALLAVSRMKPEIRWTQLCYRAMMHAGNTDSTGSIAGFLYGVTFGFEGVPKGHYEEIEYHEELASLAHDLFELQKRS